MRRNKMMRAACLLMVLTMITTCSFSGALAKYVVSDYTTDTARVAKFGVVVTAAGDLFGPSYGGSSAASSATAQNSIQVWGLNSNYVANDTSKAVNVVAPGTKNDKGMTFSVKGTPEVSTKLTLDAPEGDGTNGTQDKDFANTDIYLKTGTYSIMVPVSSDDVTITTDNMANYYSLSSTTFSPLAAVPATTTTVYKRVQLTGGTNSTMSDNYYPIDWIIDGMTTLNGVNAMAAVGTSNSILKAISDALGEGKFTHTPNEEWDADVNLTWKWDFTGAGGGAFADVAADVTLENWENTNLRDLEDTVLGQMMALAGADGNGQATPSSMDYLIASGTDLVKYTKITANADPSANEVIVAYTGDTAPTTWNGANVACLTATFGARVTVEQLDFASPAPTSTP